MEVNVTGLMWQEHEVEKLEYPRGKMYKYSPTLKEDYEKVAKAEKEIEILLDRLPLNVREKNYLFVIITCLLDTPEGSIEEDELRIPCENTCFSEDICMIKKQIMRVVLPNAINQSQGIERK